MSKMLLRKLIQKVKQEALLLIPRAKHYIKGLLLGYIKAEFKDLPEFAGETLVKFERIFEE